MTIFELLAKITLDSSEYEQGLKGAEDKGESTAARLAASAGGAGKTAAKALGGTVAAAAVAVGAITSSAVSAYADYEQLVGGVDTLFGDASEKVQGYAKQAYATAGISANQYMEQATSFSASLLQSLGGDTEKAADLTDMAIRDMADNANKMGTDLGSIQNAYQGFAKGNYTMLDNLKLGYGGTKEEMDRLLKDATALSGIEYDVGNLGDVFSAIHVIQDNLGITGTTSEEAADTISGSMASMKAAWDNLLVGMATGDESTIDGFVDALTKMAKTVIANLIPRLSTTMKGVAHVVRDLAPLIAQELPGLIAELVPEVISAAGALIIALVNALPSLAKALIDALPQLLEALGGAIKGLWNQLMDMIGEAIGVDMSAIKFTDIKDLPLAEKSLVDFSREDIEALKRYQRLQEELGNQAYFQDENGVWQDTAEYLKAQAAGLPEGLEEAYYDWINHGGAANLDEVPLRGEMSEADLQAQLDGMTLDAVIRAQLAMPNGLTGDFTDGSHAAGLNYVPYDGYIAELHRGESVLTRAQADSYRGGGGGMDTNAIANAIAAAVARSISGLGVYMHGEAVGELVAPTVNSALGDAAQSDRYSRT